MNLSALFNIMEQGDQNRIAAAEGDLKYWRSPLGIARVMNAAKNFVDNYNANDKEGQNGEEGQSGESKNE